MKEDVHTCLNPLGKYRVVDKKGKVIEMFRTKNAAIEWINKNQKYYLHELRLEK